MTNYEKVKTSIDDLVELMLAVGYDCGNGCTGCNNFCDDTLCKSRIKDWLEQEKTK